MRLFLLVGFAAACLAGPVFADVRGHESAEVSQCRPMAIAHASGTERRARSSVQVWADANQAARQRPGREGFEAARYIYTYAQGAIFELYANPNFISTILLETGETLTSVAAGDTSRWQVSEAIAEGEHGLRTMLLVKPAAIGLRTNIVLVTDRRTYLVEAISQAGEAYSAEIAWCYPHSDAAHASTSAGAFNFDYRVRVVRGSRPVWAPVRVFDDGQRTWIEFSAATAASELPPLFVITGEGAELVNYRIDGRRYVVDRVFDRAELRLGVRAPQIVRIERSGLVAAGQRTPRGRP
ncbi:MAG TPA: TrbG/VirB9 family P-type conjugative transfer protein [Terricaulis sp.]|nr:TrbG/VirB9 family P-type conjugative transfer protein [Terricaulis sp.]